MNLTLPFFAALALAGTAQAQSASIRYADLDLSKPAGQAELERRIEAATRQVCPVETRAYSRIRDLAAQQHCEAGVRAQVAEQMPR
jgi:UrcA family protein